MGCIRIRSSAYDPRELGTGSNRSRRRGKRTKRFFWARVKGRTVTSTNKQRLVRDLKGRGLCVLPGYSMSKGARHKFY